MEANWHFLGLAPLPLPVNFSQVFQIHNDEIWVFRLGTELTAISNVCPHKMGPLAEGQIINGRVECPWHGYTFDLITGECTSNKCPKLHRYDVSVDSASQILARERKE